ncbi:hypothetical protein LCGC14_2593900, partial [marine sediment metagenome]
MLNLFRKGNCGLIGLDVGAEGIRMLQLERSKVRFGVVAAARWHYPPNALAGDMDPAERRRLAAGAIDEMLKKGCFRGRNVVSCIRSDSMSVKNVRLPHMSPEELAGAVEFECQERFGFEVTSDRIHYIEAGEVRQGTETRDEVILMAVTEEVIEEHLEMLAEMHLRSVHIDAESTALFRAYQRLLRRAQDEASVTVVVDIGLTSTRVMVARGPTIVLIKTVDIAGHTFNESVAKELGLG